ncbi:MAG: hypothetical protein HYY30_01120 [Chloroflexi bacterium]|nr:hypothetical protein [Chloroflexota bacterium]
MTTLILSKDELRTLKGVAKQKNVTLAEAVKLLIREKQEIEKKEVPPCTD